MSPVFRDVVMAALGTVFAGSWPAAASADGLLDRLVAIESACGSACGVPTSAGELPGLVDSLVGELSEAPGVQAGGVNSVKALNQFVFQHLGIKATPELDDSANLMPSTVLQRRRGYCVGIAAVYLLLAERLNLPIHAVATPSHLFLRYDDGTTRINIETFEQGGHLPDERYAREHRIPEVSIRKGVFLRNLTTDELLAQVHNNLGVIHSRRQRYADAAREYRTALRLHSRFPAAWYNWGIDLLTQDDYRHAARRFSRSLRLYPTDVWALNNRGLAYARMEKPDKAKRDFEAALRIEPTFEPARRNLDQVPATP